MEFIQRLQFSLFPSLFDMISGKMVEYIWGLKIEPSNKH